VQEVYLENLTQFSPGRNAIDTAAFNRDGFLSRDTCVPATYLNRPIYRKQSLFHVLTPNLQAVFLPRCCSF
jgi:hypothetical protein